MTKLSESYGKYKFPLLKHLGLCAILWILTSCRGEKPLAVSAQADPVKLQGTWYTLAAFEEGNSCSCTRYTLAPPGPRFRLNRTCFDSELRESQTYTGWLEGVNAFRQLRFNYKLLPQEQYYVLDVTSDHNALLLGTKSRKDLMILSKNSKPAASVFKQFLNRAEELEYDTGRIRMEDQNCE